MKVDYIVVGFGLAGLAFCETLRQHDKQVLVFNDQSQQSSKVAGGLYNPVILKRFTAPWKAQELLRSVTPFYTEVEQYLNIKALHKMPIFRIFNSVEEQNNWFAASDKPNVSEFLADTIHTNTNVHVKADFGLGEVYQTGRIDINLVIDQYSHALKSKNALRETSFDYMALEINDSKIRYQDIEADYIVFADGFGLKQNPYFDYLPLIGSKGEYIVVASTELKLEAILKGPVFIIPLSKDRYLVGATYDNHDKTGHPTQHAKQELITKLQNMIACDFKVIDHMAAIRPTVKDRRPLVGKHPIHERLFIINGLGTRGVMASPYLAQNVFDHIENKKALDSDSDIKRFENLFIV